MQAPWNCSTPTVRAEDALRERIQRRDNIRAAISELDAYLEAIRENRMTDDEEAERIAAADEESVGSDHSWRPRSFQ